MLALRSHISDGFDVREQFAELCDSVRYLAPEGSRFDGDITAPLKELLASDETPKFIMINVRGSHEDFRDRYPQAYARFKETDYPAELPVRNRQILAAYDNSIAYTDDVMFQWIEASATESSILIYFSDHGLDIYESNESHCGHGDPENPASYEASIKIPLFFYFSDEYKSENPQAWERLIENRHKPVNTTDFIATLLDILNVDFTDKPGFIERNSMLSDNYVIKTPYHKKS